MFTFYSIFSSFDQSSKLGARAEYINRIIEHLSVLKGEVELRSKVNLQDINVHSEQFFKILLNEIYGFDLKNINIVEQNAAVIDLGDETNRIAIQVTSNNSKKKIDDTYNAFIEKELYNKYDRLIILIIKTKTPRTGSLTDSNFTFNYSNDVWDITEIIRVIQDIDDLDKLKTISEWLWKELVEKYYEFKKHSKPNEVVTFIKLIDIISDEQNHQEFELEGEPDPKYKIEQRFEEYSVFLKNLYGELTIDYGFALSEVEAGQGIPAIKIRKVSNYLKDVSQRHLTASDNNPQTALDNLTEFFSDFFKKDGVNYDEMAIKYFLIHQLIKCNVFPN